MLCIHTFCPTRKSYFNGQKVELSGGGSSVSQYGFSLVAVWMLEQNAKGANGDLCKISNNYN